MSARVGAGVNTEEEDSDWIAFIINQLFLFWRIDDFGTMETGSGDDDDECKVVGLALAMS